MKKIFAIAFLGLSMNLAAFAQDNSKATESKKIVKPSRDHFMIQLSNDRWTNVPDSIHLKNSGRGLGLYLMYDFPIKESNFSFGAGLGVRFSNIYFDNQKMVLDSHNDKIIFKGLDSTIFRGSKYATTYVEFPLELRYFANKDNRNKGFKFAIGAKVAYTGIGGAYYKDKESISGKYVSRKTVSNRFSQQWRLTPTARIGWGNISAFVEYTPTPIFKAGTGPDVRPLNFGVVISGL
ncbi:MAG TPA: outer membrane beta-barrel protein [Edaphocola sp.]|nr:outer membrane beta-barrel protein [Edaphocola sp.]